MNCNDANLSAYLDQELPAPDRRAVEAHLRACPDCAATLKDLERVRTMLLTQAIPMGLHGPVIDRIRKEESTPSQKFRTYAIAVAMIAVAAIAGYAAFRHFNAPMSGPPESHAPIVAIDRDNSRGLDQTVIAQNDTTLDGTPVAAPPTALPETSLPLTLTGTLLGGDPQAVLKNNDTGEQHIYRPGDSVLDEVILQDVQQTRIILSNRGDLEVLTKGPGVIASRPRLDGRWQLAVLVDDKVVDYGDTLTFEETGGIVRVTDSNRDDFGEARLDGNILVVTRIEGGDEIGALRGTFNNAFTEVVMSSPELSASLASDMSLPDPENHSYAVKLSRIDENSPNQDPRAILQARLDEVRAMYEPLRDYAKAHNGQFPSALSLLIPDYTASTDLYASRDDRVVTYVSGQALPQTRSFPGIPGCSNSPDPGQALLAHEAELQQLWGGPAPFVPNLIEVAYRDPDQIVTLSAQGSTSSRSMMAEFEALATDATAVAAQWSAMIASDQNNLKQLGLVNKMFANENCEYTMPGFCTVYPEYLSDTNVLTSPWHEAGILSYEILFRAMTEEDLEAMAVDYLAAQGEVDFNDPALRARAQSMVPLMYNIEDIPAVGGKPATRNVLFLDGHVERMSISDFDERVGPFLR
ncbi:MAG: zf-HC2 domain-containing protein [Candidatus Hydrogenedentes bacterium]|nr:zf-HC2 domain-containing protein [Candidatus Hydrogenedentota bacterium]